MKMVLVGTLLCLLSAAVLTDAEAQVAETVHQEETLLIGLIPEQNIFDQLERYQPVADYLGRKIGATIKLKILTRYGNVIDDFTLLGLDGAFFGSFTYALAHHRLGLEVLARPEDIKGISRYHGLIFVRKDSGIKTAEDMRGKRFAFVDKATTAGYLLPLAYFRENGIEDYESYFKDTYFAGTHEDAILDVLNRRADIGAAKNTVFERLSETEKRIKDDLVLLGRSPDVPENGLAVRKDLSDALKNALKRVLLSMDEDPEGIKILEEFGARRFIETTDHDYDPVFKYAEEINLNLSTYDYSDE